MSRSVTRAALCFCISASVPTIAQAHSPKTGEVAHGAIGQLDAPIEESADGDDAIIVYGRALDQIGIAATGSQGTVGYQDFDGVPISRIGELVENVPGIIATQHSGTGKANQYFLRGFNLDHGTDLAGFVDGVPINMRSHGHGQGYLDFNFLIPEIVERIDFRKGPYFNDVGDFTAAGTIGFQTLDEIDPFVQVEVGEFGFVRGVSAGSLELGQGDLLLAVDGQVYDGPWVLDEDLERIAGLAKYSFGSGNSSFDVQVNGYSASWTSTDQIAERAVLSGAIDRFGFIDDDLGGETTRLGAVVNGQIGSTRFNAFATLYDFRLVSNFTYFLEDPVNGDEFIQTDERYVFGGSLSHSFPIGQASATLGADARHDAIQEVGLFRSVDAIAREAIRRDSIDQTSLGAFAEVTVPLAPGFRATGGARFDYMTFDVEALRSPNSGDDDADIFTPTLGLAWQPVDKFELYANYGQSFHSNDVRGATIAIDPATAEPAQRVPVFSRAEGAEFGARLEADRISASVVGFWLELDSELVFVGDGGATEPNDGSRRYGIEANAFWRPTDWIAIDAAYSYTDARFVGVDSGAREIPGAVPEVISAGVSARLTDSFTFNTQLRHFGSAPLIEDNSAQSDPTTLVNVAGSYGFGPVTLGIELFNLFDVRDADITYFYESRLAREPAEGVADRHFHPVEPFQIRGSLKVNF